MNLIDWTLQKTLALGVRLNNWLRAVIKRRKHEATEKKRIAKRDALTTRRIMKAWQKHYAGVPPAGKPEFLDTP